MPGSVGDASVWSKWSDTDTGEWSNSMDVWVWMSVYTITRLLGTRR